MISCGPSGPHAGGDRTEEASLQEAEHNTIRRLAPELARHYEAFNAAYDLLQDMLVLVPEMRMRDMPLSLKVVIPLVARLVNDLRCVALLAERGYSVQACGLTASMFEVAYTVAFIGEDNSLAEEWANHDDPTRQVWNLWEVTKEGLRKSGVSELCRQLEVEYRVYSQLCMAKHANPLFQSEYSYRPQTDKTMSPIHGPEDPESVRAAQFAMEHAVGLALVATASFLEAHLSKIITSDTACRLKTAFEALGVQRKALEAEAIKRWGTEDPFPGKWRKAKPD